MDIDLNNKSSTVDSVAKYILEQARGRSIVYVCVGSDAFIYDSLGPLVGTMLLERGIQNVIGTLEDPMHAVNIYEKLALLKTMYKDHFVVAIDSCLCLDSGKLNNIYIQNSPVCPGLGTGKRLPPVGDISIKSPMHIDNPFYTHRLRHVYAVASTITDIAWNIKIRSVAGRSLAI
jgi:putative sporulation protein YyaC